tara:strand:+ start:504 stop:1202 length:699 start_codon:yes stop_codon:yes gene_type:complete
MPLIISIEGNIGSGKTTILNNFEKFILNEENGWKKDHFVFVREPVNIWQSIKDKNSKNILEKFYENPVKYSFAFQVMAYATRTATLAEAIAKNPNCKYVICERSLEADNMVFAKMLKNENNMEDVEYEIYEYFYKTRKQDMNVDAVVYVDADPSVSLERIKQRDRNGETNISLEYLEKCKHYHDTWLNNAENIQLLQLDTNCDATYNKEDREDCGNIWLSSIQDFITQLYNV